MNNIFITKSNLHIGNQSKFYTAKARYNDMILNITYDCNSQDIIIHEWYKLSKNQIIEVTEELKNILRISQHD